MLQRLSKGRRKTVVQAGCILVLPDPVQLLPLGALELGTRIFGPGVRANGVGPVGGQRRCLDSVFDGVYCEYRAG